MITKADPTGQSSNRRRTIRVLNARLENARKQSIREFKSISATKNTYKSIVNNAAFYDYENVNIDKNIDYIINKNLDTPEAMPIDWYYKQELEIPYRQGTVQELNNFNHLLEAAVIAGLFKGRIAPRPIEPVSVLFTDSYRVALEKQYTGAFNDIKSLSQTTSKQVKQVINAGVAAGKSPTDISKEITERFNVSKANAERIAETEVNKAYTDAVMATTKAEGERTGLKTGVRHISALTGTTRAHHAARHGNVYTTMEQQAWWNEGVNRINCKCGVESVLIK